MAANILSMNRLPSSGNSDDLASDRTSWHETHLRQLLSEFVGRPTQAMEIGVGEGRSTIWLCNEILRHEDSNIVCIDAFLGHGSQQFALADQDALHARFKRNTERQSSKIKLLRGLSGEILRQIPPDEVLDIVYIAGSPKSWHVLEDAILTWRNLKVGGVMIFDAYAGGDSSSHHFPQVAINGFLACFQDSARVLHMDYHMVIRKISAEVGGRVSLNANGSIAEQGTNSNRSGTGPEIHNTDDQTPTERLLAARSRSVEARSVQHPTQGSPHEQPNRSAGSWRSLVSRPKGAIQA